MLPINSITFAFANHTTSKCVDKYSPVHSYWTSGIFDHMSLWYTQRARSWSSFQYTIIILWVHNNCLPTGSTDLQNLFSAIGILIIGLQESDAHHVTTLGTTVLYQVYI